MKSTIVVLLLSLLTLSAHVTTSQTRPRRLGEVMPEPSPSPGTSEMPKPAIESPGARPAVLNPESSQDLDVVRVETNLVTVPVSVVDRAGRSISDLQRQDFQLAEDGVDQE